MTPEEKIAALVEHIKKEYPQGCSGVKCHNCVLYNAAAASIESATCEFMYRLHQYSAM